MSLHSICNSCDVLFHDIQFSAFRIEISFIKFQLCITFLTSDGLTIHISDVCGKPSYCVCHKDSFTKSGSGEGDLCHSLQCTYFLKTDRDMSNDLK